MPDRLRLRRGAGGANSAEAGGDSADTSRYLRITGDEPDTADPQCTDNYYDIALNVFDRLVEVRTEADGSSGFAPSLALDRNAILMTAYGGRGDVENGIFPHGLIGYNPELPEIPYDPQTAAALLDEAGYSGGFDLEITVDDEPSNYREVLELAAAMWEKIGIRSTIRMLEKDEFSQLRRDGKIACYASRFSVDYNDPDAIIYVFFGDLDNARSRSLCYDNADVIRRVEAACGIIDEAARLAEYRELERVIVQDDCAWIPLFSNQHYFIVNKRVKNFRVSWNGWTNTQYRDIVIEA